MVAFDYSPRAQNEFRQRLENAFYRVLSLHDLSDHDAAQCIADVGCDLVIDLKGWTASNRSAILASRPASVQVQWLGFAGTLGAPWIDYIVADPAHSARRGTLLQRKGDPAAAHVSPERRHAARRQSACEGRIRASRDRIRVLLLQSGFQDFARRLR
jgi:hypothetical protein